MSKHPAQAFASAVAKDNGFPDVARRAIDTDYGAKFPCYIIADGLVVYEDEPDCVVSIDARPGRLLLTES